MTESERICNKIGEKFFSKDNVYENLKYINEENNKVELCDALFESSDMYLAIQIKERNKNNQGKSDEQWLKDVVYGKAFEQMKSTIDAIKSNQIYVNDLYHQKVVIKNDNIVFPLIIFDCSSINNYKKIINYNDVNINILSIMDYEKMMEVLILPYDIFYYLQERGKWLSKNNSLPNVVVGENYNSITLSQVRNEEDFAAFFKNYIYDGDKNQMDNALKLQSVINKLKDDRPKGKTELKIIINILQSIRPKDACGFVERFFCSWENACNDKFNFSKGIILNYDSKNIGIIFFSLGKKQFENHRFYEVLCDAKQLQGKLDAVLLISFVGFDNKECYIEWIYYEKPYAEDQHALDFYTEVGMYNGTVDRELFELMCKKMLNEE